MRFVSVIFVLLFGVVPTAAEPAPQTQLPALPGSFDALSKLYDNLASMQPKELQIYLEASAARINELASADDPAKMFFYAQIVSRTASLLLASQILQPPNGWQAIRSNEDIYVLAGSYVSLSLKRTFINSQARTVRLEMTFKTDGVAPLRRPGADETPTKVGQYDAVLRLNGNCAAIEFVVGKLALRIADVCEENGTAAVAAARERAQAFMLDRQAKAAFSLLSDQSDQYVKVYGQTRMSDEDIAEDAHFRPYLLVMNAALKKGNLVAVIGAAHEIRAHSKLYNALRRCLPEKIKWVRGAKAPEPVIGCDMCFDLQPPWKLIQAKYFVQRCDDEHHVCLIIESLAPGDQAARDDTTSDGALDLDSKATQAFYKRRFRLSVSPLLTPQYGPHFLKQIDTSCLNDLPDLYLPQ